MTAQLSDARLESNVRSQGRLLEIHCENLAFEGSRALAVSMISSKRQRAIGHEPQIVGGPIRQCQEILGHFISA
jgi:hypothetical protein